jgi:hypothetical protein
MVQKITILLLTGMLAVTSKLHAQAAPKPEPAKPAQETAAPKPEAKTSTQAAEPLPDPDAPHGWKRFNIGFRVRGFPYEIFPTKEVGTTINPSLSQFFSTTSKTGYLSIGPSLELVPSKRWVVSVEALYRRVGFEQTTDTVVGIDNPNTAGDERRLTTVVSKVSARFWEIPVMLRRQGLRESGNWSHVYAGIGGVIRKASNINATNNTTLPDGTTTTDGIAPAASRRTIRGAVVGFGFRLVDDFHIKVTPEFRYTRWFGATFSTQSTVTRKNQMEVGIGFTF